MFNYNYEFNNLFIIVRVVTEFLYPNKPAIRILKCHGIQSTWLISSSVFPMQIKFSSPFCRRGRFCNILKIQCPARAKIQ